MIPELSFPLDYAEDSIFEMHENFFNDELEQQMNAFVLNPPEEIPILPEVIAPATAPRKPRQKKPYTHATFACEKCRKSHRKCKHTGSAGEQGSVTKNTTLLIPAERQRRSSLPECRVASTNVSKGSRRDSFPASSTSTPLNAAYLHCTLSEAQIQFFIDRASIFFVGESPCEAATEFWKVTVPQLTQSFPLLREGMCAVCFLFDKCPRPRHVTPVDVLKHISRAFQGLRTQLLHFEDLYPIEKVVAFVVSSLLAVVTFYGLGSARDLRIHFQGLQAILQASWQDLTDTMSPARQFLLSQPQTVVMAEQPTMTTESLALLEPLLACIPAEELARPNADHGGLVHLLVITNKAIRARSRLENPLPKDGDTKTPQDVQAASVFRDFVQYRSQGDDYTNLEETSPGIRVTRAHVVAIKSIFGLAAFVSLKHSCGVHEHNYLRNLRLHISTMKQLIDAVRVLSPEAVLTWPELVLHDLEEWDIRETAACLFRGTGEDCFASPMYGSRAPAPEWLEPWSNLDGVLSNSQFVLEV